jgi:hypothetical protein
MFVPDHESIMDRVRQDILAVPASAALPIPAPPEDPEFIKNSLEKVRKQLAQVPEGKNGVLVSSVKMNGFTPTFTTGVAVRVRGGWEVHGEAFASKGSKGASVTIVKTW